MSALGPDAPWSMIESMTALVVAIGAALSAAIGAIVSTTIFDFGTRAKLRDHEARIKANADQIVAIRAEIFTRIDNFETRVTDRLDTLIDRLPPRRRSRPAPRP